MKTGLALAALVSVIFLGDKIAVGNADGRANECCGPSISLVEADGGFASIVAWGYFDLGGKKLQKIVFTAASGSGVYFADATVDGNTWKAFITGLPAGAYVCDAELQLEGCQTEFADPIKVFVQ